MALTVSVPNSQIELRLAKSLCTVAGLQIRCKVTLLIQGKVALLNSQIELHIQVPKTLGIGLRLGPRGVRCLVSEVTL